MVYFSFTTQQPMPPAMRKRDWNKLIKWINRLMAEYWHDNFSEKHFTEEGAKEYGYTPRAGQNLPTGTRAFRHSYTGHKYRFFRHRLPLVYTGDSMRAVAKKDIRATSTRARVVMNAPTLNFRNPHTQIDMRKEMETVSDREIREIHNYAQRQFNRLIRRFKKRVRVKIAA